MSCKGREHLDPKPQTEYSPRSLADEPTAPDKEPEAQHRILQLKFVSVAIKMCFAVVT